ncbi:hypothetical protein AB3N59_12960 [Leptospira sp. WS92.C1]
MSLIYHPKRKNVISLLRTANLPTDDLLNLDLSNFIGYEKDARMIGIIGLEQTGNYALLRSLVVSDLYKN